MTDSKSKFWLDQITDEIISRYPSGEVRVSSGHSPSGVYHVGTIRELATASSLAWSLRRRGRQASHIDFVDDFDILRKIPADLPEEFKSELGKPLYLARGPQDHKSYGEHFYHQLEEALKQTGFAADETFFASNTYVKEHRYTEAITKALQNLQRAKEIIESVSQRQLPSDWAPVQLLSDDGRLNEWSYAGHDLDRQVINYRDKNGNEGELSYADGRVKLDWRLDWPARWWMWNINVEPFGRDHATKGGSYDTGKELVREIFGGEPPMPVPYDFILTPGDTKKMSKSAGGVITPKEALEVMPPEILRYFIVRSRPSKQLFFDSGTGLYNLVDEFAGAEQAVRQHQPHPFKEAAEFALAGEESGAVISSVPFKHLVSVYQAASGDEAEALEILSRTGYQAEVSDQSDVIKREFQFVKNWLDKYAPDEVKFSVQEELPKADLSDHQKEFMSKLADKIESEGNNIDGQKMHELIYAAKDEAGLDPKTSFQAIYRVILGKDFGPKAGWFLSSLDHDWLINRLRLQA